MRTKKKHQLQLFTESAADGWPAVEKFARAAAARLAEAGRVLSADNEQRLRGAVEAISEVLSQLDSAPADGESTDATATEAKRKLVEAWSDSAWNASSGAYLLASLIDIMGAESDEPEQFALLMQAFNAVSAWITAEIGEIGTPEDGEDDIGIATVIFDYESLRKRKIGVAMREAVGAAVPLREGAIRSDGTARLKVIAPGWGSSGYYSADVLERDGPKAFPAGTKTFWDHPTESEEAERPERSLRDLAGRTTSGVVWEADGPQGPGLYTDAQVTSDFAPTLNELADFIGVSIRALGTAHSGEAEGKSGPIIDALIAGESIDYVTTPGAGGRVLQILEARRQPQIQTEEVSVEPIKEAQVAPKDVVELRETVAEKDKEIARLREVGLVRDAKEHVSAKLAEKFDGLPDVTCARLIESLSKQAKADKDGNLDKVQLDEAIEKTVKSEAEYLAKAVGVGKVIGFGSTAPDASKLDEQILGGLQSLGLTEAAAKVGARGRR